jgi:transposase InsO family protein
MAKYAFIEATEKTCPHRFGIRRMCTWLGVSPSGFFTWRNRPPSARAVRRDELTALVTWSFQRSNGTYGYRRVHADLTRRGVEVGPDLVLDIMAAQGLWPVSRICWDNAMAESFFAALKNELVHRTIFPTVNHVKKAVATYIEVFYNRQRLHSAPGYRTPNEVHTSN